MVVIEHDDSQERDSAPSRPSPSAETAPDSAPSGSGNADDGFETASDGELADPDDQRPDEPPQQETQSKISDDELGERALAQGNDAKLEGNKLYANGEFEEALSKYELALFFAPDMPSSVELRSTCHSNRAMCYLKLGKFEDTIKECTKALELNPSYIKALLRRADAHEKLEHFEEAIADMKRLMELDPSNDQAKKTVRRLEPLAEAKREKMKEEMIAKLKDMGNSLLGRFGMSVDNFKAVKDPNTGSYSISFQQ